MIKLSRYVALSALIFSVVSMYAVPANTVVATIPVGVTPDQAAITPDNRFAYVVNNNNYGIAGSVNVCGAGKYRCCNHSCGRNARSGSDNA